MIWDVIVSQKREGPQPSILPCEESSRAGSLQATARSPFSLIIPLIATALCAACNGSNPPGSAIPSSHADRKIHRLSQSGVVVDPSQVGAKVSTAVLGADMQVWFDITQPNMAASFVQAGMTTTRWPGGKGADRYHWRTNTDGVGICGAGFNLGKPNPNSTFDNFMTDIALPAHLDVSITVNYGSNPQCTARRQCSRSRSLGQVRECDQRL